MVGRKTNNQTNFNLDCPTTFKTLGPDKRARELSEFDAHLDLRPRCVSGAFQSVLFHVRPSAFAATLIGVRAVYPADFNPCFLRPIVVLCSHLDLLPRCVSGGFKSVLFYVRPSAFAVNSRSGVECEI